MSDFTLDELVILRRCLLDASDTPHTGLLARLDAVIAAERGSVRLFRITLDLATNFKRKREAAKELPLGHVAPLWAPTLNEYNGMKGWEKAKVRAAVDDEIRRLVGVRWHYPGCHVVEKMRLVRGKPVKYREGGERRLVIVTRRSSRRPDELSADAIGGKIPIDRLVAACILRDDSDQWCAREARWEQCPNGMGSVTVEVFTIPET